jgi:hypothetical protein
VLYRFAKLIFIPVLLHLCFTWRKLIFKFILRHPIAMNKLKSNIYIQGDGGRKREQRLLELKKGDGGRKGKEAGEEEECA